LGQGEDWSRVLRIRKQELSQLNQPFDITLISQLSTRLLIRRSQDQFSDNPGPKMLFTLINLAGDQKSIPQMAQYWFYLPIFILSGFGWKIKTSKFYQNHLHSFLKSLSMGSNEFQITRSWLLAINEWEHSLELLFKTVQIIRMSPKNPPSFPDEVFESEKNFTENWFDLWFVALTQILNFEKWNLVIVHFFEKSFYRKHLTDFWP
jgi:hypothetical protein